MYHGDGWCVASVAMLVLRHFIESRESFLMTAIRSLGYVLVLGTILLGSSLPAFSQTDPRPNENSGAAGVSTTPRETRQAEPPQTELPPQSTSDPAGRAPSGAADTRPTESPAEPEAHGTRL